MSTRILPDWLEAYMEYTENTSPPDLFKLWTGLFTISACLKRKCVLPWGMFQTYPNVYVVLVAPPGVGKGVSMLPAEDLLHELNVNMAADVTTKEALIRALKRSDNESGIVVDGKTLEIHSSLVIFSTELATFLGYQNVELMGYLCKWYDCERKFEYDTKDKALADYVNNVWVSMIGGTTPQMIQTHMPTDTIGLGLASRIIFVYEHREGKICPIPYLTEHQQKLRPLLIKDLEQVLIMRGRFSYTREFLEHFIEWHAAHKQQPVFTDDRLAGYINRRPIHVLKLCMLISASRSSSMLLDDSDLSRAIYILEETEKKMPNVFSGVGKNPLAQTIHRAMAIILQGGDIGYEELYKLVSDDVDAYNFERVVRSLETSEFAKVFIEGKKRIVRRVK